MIQNCKHYFSKYVDYVQNIKALVAIKKSYIMLIPIIIIGAIAMAIEVVGGTIGYIGSLFYQVTMGIMAIWIVMSMCFAYISMQEEKIEVNYALPISSIGAFLVLMNISSENFDIVDLDYNSMLIAVVVAIVSCEIYFRIKNIIISKQILKMTGVDKLIATSIRAIIPAMVVLLVGIIFRSVFNLIFSDKSAQKIFVEHCSMVFGDVGDDFLISVLYMLSIHLLWVFGIHGNIILDAVGQEKLAMKLSENTKLVERGMKPTNIINKSMLECFVYMGGTGAVLCIVICVLVFIKRKSIRKICWIGLVPSLCNVSEVIAFGLPIVLNPSLALPFLLVPFLLFLLTYYSMYVGIVPLVVNNVDWTTPPIVSGYMATGSIRGSILQILLIVIGVLLYYPFINDYVVGIERRLSTCVDEMKKELIELEKVNGVSNFLQKNNKIGDAARSMASDLKNDIKNQKLFLVYQPQVNEKGEYIGAEALIRWIHPVAGFIYPPLIIALAKEAKILDKLETFIMDEVCEKIKYLEENYDAYLKISANITIESLRNKYFENIVEHAVVKHSIERTRLWLEITEQDAFSGDDEIINKLNSLKKKGHTLLIDDFGMGHTSMLYLQKSIFDYVKLDGSITKDVIENDRNTMIISSIVHLSKTLNFGVIAEYVETENQRDKLHDLGVNIYQGYYYSKPVDFNEFVEQLNVNMKKLNNI